jgi:hypothetical protein
MAKSYRLTFQNDIDFDALTQKLTESGFGGALVEAIQEQAPSPATTNAANPIPETPAANASEAQAAEKAA